MKKILLLLFIMSITILFSANISHAELSNQDILDNVLQRYREAANSWSGVIQKYAEYFFAGLAVIGFVWQISQAYFQRSDFSGFMGEIIRYMAFCGVFLWFLRNGPELAKNIIDAMQIIGAEASGTDKGLNPSNIVDIGFQIYATAQTNLDWSPTSFAAFGISIAVLIIFALVGINMLLQLCSAWVLAYAGIIFLGFGGSYWTKDMAINYFKTVLGVGVSLMTMTLLIGIGTDIVNDTVIQMNSSGAQQLTEMAALLITAITLFMLVDKLPSLVAGIINGASIGSSGIGAFGAGAAVGAALTAKEFAGNQLRRSANILGGAVKTGTAAVTGTAGLVSAYKASKEGLIGKNTDEFNKAYESGGISSESLGFVKPPSATAILSDMGKGAGQMVASSLGSAFSNAKENSFGGKLAKTISEKGEK